MKKDKIYMETDDTLDVGKKPLPRTEKDKKIFEEMKNNADKYFK